MKKLFKKLLLSLVIALTFVLSATMLTACNNDDEGHLLSITHPELGIASGVTAFSVEVFGPFNLPIWDEDGSVRNFVDGERIPENSNIRISWRVLSTHSAVLRINGAAVTPTSVDHHLMTVTDDVSIELIAAFDGPAVYHPVTFSLLGGQMPTGQDTVVQVRYGRFAARPANPPTHPVYNYFAGWYTLQTGGEQFAFAATPITAPTTIFARWSTVYVPQPRTVTVAANLPDGVTALNVYYSGTRITAPETEVSTGAVLTIHWTVDQTNPLIRVFVHVNGHPVTPAITNGGTFTVTALSTTLTIYAVQQVQITFDLNNGQRVGGAPPMQTIDINTEAALTPLPNPTKANYHFIGWGEASNAAITWNFNNVVTRSKTLYAIFSEGGAPWQPNSIYFHYYHAPWITQPNQFNSWAVHVWAYGEQGVTYRFDQTLFNNSTGAVARVSMTDEMISANRIGFLVHQVNPYTGVPISDSRGWIRDNAVNEFIFNLNARSSDENILHVFMGRGEIPRFRLSQDEPATDWNPQRSNPIPRLTTTIDRTRGGTLPVPNRNTWRQHGNPQGALVTSGGSWGNIANWDWAHWPIAPTAPHFRDNVGVGYQIFSTTFARSPRDDQRFYPYNQTRGNPESEGYPYRWGTLRGVTDVMRDDYFCDLGVGVIWLTPINLAGSYHMYDVICFYTIDPRVGGRYALDELLEEAADRGIKILMDLVANHVSHLNQWFLNAVSRHDTPEHPNRYRNFFNIRHYTQTQGGSRYWHDLNMLIPGAPQGTPVGGGPGSPNFNYRYFSYFHNSMPDLNLDYGPVRDEIVNVALYWLNAGVTGFRLDAINHAYDANEYCRFLHSGGGQADLGRGNHTRNAHFWREFNYRITVAGITNPTHPNFERDFPNAFLIGENFTGEMNQLGPYYRTMDTLFSFYFSDRQPRWISETNNPWGNWFVDGIEGRQNIINYYRGEAAVYSPFTSNHDRASLINMMGLSGHGEYGNDNHRNAWYRARVAGAATLTVPGISWIYFGDELGMSGPWIRNPSNPHYPGLEGEHYDRWRRRPFLHTTGGCPIRGVDFYFHGSVGHRFWDLTLNDFNRNVQGAEQQANDQFSMLSHFRTFGKASANPVMTRGNFSRGPETNSRVASFQMELDGEIWMIFHNFNATPFVIQPGWRAGTSYVIAASRCPTRGTANADNLPGFGSLILSNRSQ